MKRKYFFCFLLILTYTSFSKPLGEINVHIDSTMIGVLEKPLFGVFMEYIAKRVNGKYGISAQELEDRGFDSELNGMTWESFQYWNLHNTCNKDSIKEEKIWYSGYNKRGLRHYLIKRTAKTGETGYKQDIILDSGKTFDFYVYVMGTVDSVYLRLTSKQDGKIIFDSSLGKVPGNWEKRATVISPLSKQTNVEVLLYTKKAGDINFDESSLMSRDNKYTLRKEFFDLMKELKPKLMRFPGGCYADYSTWHFELSIGDYDQRYAPNYWYDATIMRMDFSLDEYFAFCKELDIEPYITINYGNGTIQEALNLLEYCNGDANTKYGKLRARNGHPEPYKVKYFEVGNEQWERFDPNYPKNYLGYYKALKEYDPSIKVLVNGFNWDGIKEIQRVFGEVKNNADYYSCHPAYVIQPELQLNQEEEYWGMVSMGAITQNDINLTMQGLGEYSGPDTKYSPTEYWTQYTNLETWIADSTYKSRSLEAAIGDLNFIHTFIRNWEHMGPACRTLFLGFYKEDPTPEGGRAYFGTAGFHALKMLFNHSGKDFVPTDYFGDSFTLQNFKVMDFVKNIPLLDVIATKDADSLYLCVINRHISDSVSANLNISNWRNKQKTKIYQLYSPHYLDNNSGANPNLIIPTEKDSIINSNYSFPPHSYTILAIPLSDISAVEPGTNNGLKYTLFPNPAENEIIFDTNGDTIDFVQLYDITGKLVLSLEKNIKGFSVINLSGLSSGEYIIKASINGNKITDKFIKE